MSRTAWTGVAAMAVVVTMGACAGNPRPGDRGYPFNVTGTYDASIEALGVVYAGPAEITTSSGGLVHGAIRLAGPENVSGDLQGAVTGDTLTFDSSYERDGGCTGVLSGTGRIDEGGAAVSGTAVVDDDCSGVRGHLHLQAEDRMSPRATPIARRGRTWET